MFKTFGTEQRHKVEAYLQQAVTIDQQVSGFDVPVQDPSRVQVLQTWAGTQHCFLLQGLYDYSRTQS